MIASAASSLDRASTSRTGAPTRQRIYRPELDALRFFAFFAVFAHHTLNVTGRSHLARSPRLGAWIPALGEFFGFGLPLFFFLSSYLITSLLQVEKARTGRIDLRKFYVRRILRIWPLYFSFVGAMFLLGLTWKTASVEPGRLLAFLLLSGNWYAIAFGTGSTAVAYLWSISIEEQFYLFWASLSRILTARRMAIASWSITALCLASTCVLAETGSSRLNLWVNSLVQSLFFSTGALLALRIGILQQARSIGRALVGLGAGLLVWLAAARFGGMQGDNSAIAPVQIALGYAAVAIGCVLILWGSLLVPLKFIPYWLIYLGRISYGLYVFHGLVLSATRELAERWKPAAHLPVGSINLVQIALTIGLAALSYQFLEKPFLKLKDRFELVHTRAA